MLERDHQLSELRRRDAQRQAEAHRLARAARQDVDSMPLHHALLAWLGRRLVRAGFRLLIWAKAWEHRANTVYNGEQLTGIEPLSKLNIP